MEITGYRACETSDHIDGLRREGALLAEAADRAGLGARVPACPGWRVRDLLKHLGYVHRWAAAYVGDQLVDWVDRSTEEEILRQGPEDEALPGWFREGHAHLVRTLEAADPAMACWTFLAAPSPLAFWARRQAHETAIHRADAEQAAAGGWPEPAAADGPGQAGPPFAPHFAADGVDELIMGFLGRVAARGSWRGPLGTLGFHAVDAGETAHWRVVATPGRLAVERAEGMADCAVTGPASDLYLLLWNRRPLTGLAATGDLDLLAAFQKEAHVTWR